MSNTLKKITTRAKQIRRSHPGKSWKAAVKQAGAEYRSGKKIGAKKRSPLKGRKHSHYGKVKSHRRRVNAVKPSEVNVSIGSLKSQIKKKLELRLANQLLRRETASSYKTWNHARKAVQDTKQQLRKFQ